MHQILSRRSENLLTSASGGVTLGYDPLVRLYQTVGASTTRFAYDGLDAIAEYNGSNALQRRFVFDPTTGQPVVWYEGTGTAASNRRYLSTDERGSVIGVSSSTGASLGLNTYDEYGKPGSANLGRYQYTGQKWIGEAGLYDYKARDYVPHLGIFAQTDPIGYGDGPNWYAYVGNDPVNAVDPLGLGGHADIGCTPVGDGVLICGKRLISVGGVGGGGLGGSGGSAAVEPRIGQKFADDDPIVITGKRKPQSNNKGCGNGLVSKIADWADKTSVVTGGIALTSGALGLATAPTGAGFVGFESVAVVSGGVSVLASGVGAIAHFANGDYLGAALDAGGIAGGALAGRLAGNALKSSRMFGDLSASQARQIKLANNAAGTTVGAASSLYSCR